MTFGPRPFFIIELPGSRSLRLGERPLVMGVINVTPDSFSHASIESARTSIDSILDPDRDVEAALRMEADGADLIDVGAESTRPGAAPVPAAEELRRLMPVLRRLTPRLRVPLSIDTSKAEVAAAALDAGAAIINDVSGLRCDPALAETASRSGAALILMHMRGRPSTMYDEAVYTDLIGEIARELKDSIGAATGAGVPLDRLIVDPGIGFAKHAAHSYGVLARLSEVAVALGRPVLVGPSRKSFLREASGGRPPSERDWPTAAAVTAAVLGGAHIVRVHAVPEMVQVVRAAEAIRRSA